MYFSQSRSTSSNWHPPKTGPELVAYWESVGVIGSPPDIIDSQEQASKLRHNAETRERA